MKMMHDKQAGRAFRRWLKRAKENDITPDSLTRILRQLGGRRLVMETLLFWSWLEGERQGDPDFPSDLYEIAQALA